MTSRARIAAQTIGRHVQLAPWFEREYGARGEVVAVTSRGLTVRMTNGLILKRITAADIAAWLD